MNKEHGKKIVLDDSKKQEKIFHLNILLNIFIVMFLVVIIYMIFFLIANQIDILNASTITILILYPGPLLILMSLLTFMLLNEKKIFFKMFHEKAEKQSENSIFEAGRLIGDWYYYKKSTWNLSVDSDILEYNNNLNCDCKYYLHLKKYFFDSAVIKVEITKEEYDWLCQLEYHSILCVNKQYIKTGKTQMKYRFA